MTDKEVMKLALDALEKLWLLGDQAGTTANPAIAALKERLAQPEQEPVAWMYPDDYERMTTSETFCTVYSVEVGSATRGESTVALYTAPPQRTEQGSQDWKTPPKEDAPLVKWAKEQTTPPQRKPLTDKAITKVIDSMPRGINGWMIHWDLYEFAQAIEAAHDIRE